MLSAHSAAGKVIKGIAGKKVLLECGVKTVSNSLVWRRGEELVFSVSEKSGFTRKGSHKKHPQICILENKTVDINYRTVLF